MTGLREERSLLSLQAALLPWTDLKERTKRKLRTGAAVKNISQNLSLSIN